MAAVNYEDILVGRTVCSPSRTIGESDVMLFAGLTGDLNELHTSETFAAGTKFQRRIAHGMLVLSMANGLYMRTGLFDTSVFLGIENWRAVRPVYIGDTIRLRLTIADKRLTKSGAQAIVRMEYQVVNQEDEVAAQGIFNRMVEVGPA